MASDISKTDTAIQAASLAQYNSSRVVPMKHMDVHKVKHKSIVIGASLSEPHIDCDNNPRARNNGMYVSIYVSFYPRVCRTLVPEIRVCAPYGTCTSPCGHNHNSIFWKCLTNSVLSLYTNDKRRGLLNNDWIYSCTRSLPTGNGNEKQSYLSSVKDVYNDRGSTSWSGTSWDSNPWPSIL